SGCGVASYITNSRYLASRSLRGLRSTLKDDFSDGYFLDLGGQVSERGAFAEEDENVFDIEQGVAIGLLVRGSWTASLSSVHHERRFGRRDEKYRYLNSNTVSSIAGEVHLVSPLYHFSRNVGDAEQEFNSWTALDDLMPFNSGAIITSRDNLAIDFDRNQ